jgi:hypothetical protein
LPAFIADIDVGTSFALATSGARQDDRIVARGVCAHSVRREKSALGANEVSWSPVEKTQASVSALRG